MKTRLTTIFGLLACVLAFSSQAYADPPCPGGPGGTLVVADAVTAADIGDGYADLTCNLVINTSIPVTVNPLDIRAATITIQGPDVLDPTKRVEIINTAPSGTTRIIANSGSMAVEEAVIKATNLVKIDCAAPACTTTVNLSELIASTNLAFGGPGGRLEVTGRGDVVVTATTVWGGANVNVKSQNGNVTFICQPGQGGCKDPTTSGVLNQLVDQGGNTCADQFLAGQPCVVTFNDAADVKAVCIQAPGVQCGGAAIEFHIIAALDINLEFTKLDVLGTLRIETSQGRLLAQGAELTATKYNISAKGNGTEPSIDFRSASITASNNLRITAGSNCPASPAICIDLENAILEAGNEMTIVANNQNGVIRLCGGTFDEAGSGFPKVNGDSNPPYDKNTLDVAPGECAVGATVN